MAEKKVTLSTIAEELGVSYITVSRALAGNEGVGEEMKNKIYKKAMQLGYKRLKIFPEKLNILLLIGAPYVIDNSNFSLMVQELEKKLRECNMDFKVESIDKDKQSSLEIPYNLSKDNTINGVIMLSKFEEGYMKLIRNMVDNLIVFDNHSYNVECDYVNFNLNLTGYIATKYLISKGHKNIGFISSDKAFNNIQHFSGYQEALRQNYIKLNNEFYVQDGDIVSDWLEELIKNKYLPSAFVCEGDGKALWLIKYFHNKNIKVPEEVSVIGVGNSYMSGMFIPGLTTFNLNIEYACVKAVDFLLSRIENRNIPFRSTLIETSIVERQSVKDLNI